MHNKKKVNYYLIYTFLFIILIPIVFSVFLSEKKGLIWNHDALRQHYVALIYFGNWGREVLKNIFIEHTFQIPLWDFHIGYGSDVITTMHYYVLGDPLNLFSVFVPEKYTEYLYHALIILRLYLSGVSFSFYCQEMKKNKTATLAGTFNYVFCGYMLYSGIRHPFFINPMIYLPFLLAGAERIFRKEKPTLFIFSVFLSAISNFYFFYMLVFAVCFYVAVRFFTFRHTNIGLELISTIWDFFKNAFIGLSMSAMVLLPVLTAFFSTKRIASSQNHPLLYSLHYYANLLSSFLVARHIGAWTILGFTAPAVFCLIIMFFKKRRYTPLKVSFCIMTAMLCIPFFGKALNGFSYVANRWCFIYAVLVSYILTSIWDDMVLLFSKTMNPLRSNRKNRQLTSAYILCLVLLHVCANSFYLYHTHGKNYVSQFTPNGGAYEKVVLNAPKALHLFTGTESSFYRYDTDDLIHVNVSSFLGESGIQYYWSLENSVIPAYYTDMSIPNFIVYNYKNLDHRTFLNTLASVKYAVFGKTSPIIPYGYSETDSVFLSDSKNYKIYKNNYTLPLGYTYSSYIPSEEYQNMDSSMRQEALIQGILLDEEKENTIKNDYPQTDLQFHAKPIDYTAKYNKHIDVLSDTSIQTTKKKAKITLSFQGMEHCETYLYFKGLEIEPNNFLENLIFLNIKSNDSVNKLQYMTPNHKHYKGQKEYLVNLGYHDKAQNKITITLPFKAKYQIQDLKIICQPMDSYEEQIAKRKEDILEHEKFGTNTVEGTIDLSEKKILCLTIPYSKGWSAQVDGTEVDIYKANKMFLGIPLDKGKHNIKLSYRTPNLTSGILISLAGWILFFIILIRPRKVL